MEFSTGYMDDALFRLPGLVTEARKILREVDFDTIIGTGLSGSVVIPMLATSMNKKFALVRKKGDGSHHGEPIAGSIGERWLFVDDFVCSGKTRYRVMQAVAEAAWGRQAPVTYVGQFMYRNMSYRTEALYEWGLLNSMCQ